METEYAVLVTDAKGGQRNAFKDNFADEASAREALTAFWGNPDRAATHPTASIARMRFEDGETVSDEVIADLDAPGHVRPALPPSAMDELVEEAVQGLCAKVLAAEGIMSGDIDPGLAMEMETAQRGLADVVSRWRDSRLATDRGPDSRKALADNFVSALEMELGTRTFRRVCVASARERDPRVCRSHDHCDANMVMAAAFEKTFLREPRLDNDADLATINAAWTMAKVRMAETGRSLEAGPAR